MFELFLIACVSSTCRYITPPTLYPTELHCQHQAALLTGMTAGDFASNAPVAFEFSCHLQGAPHGEWQNTKVVLAKG